jgi:formiminotetrahydrofolate cyclodeaminase
MNVQVNSAGIADRPAAENWQRQIADLEARALKAEARIGKALKDRAGIDA